MEETMPFAPEGCGHGQLGGCRGSRAFWRSSSLWL